MTGHVVPNGGTYTTADGTTYQSGETLPDCTRGDVLTTAEYTYTYKLGGWSVVVNDKTKASYDALLAIGTIEWE